MLAIRGQADSPIKLAITDVNAHGLGIEGVNTLTLRRENATLIPRNTPLPYEVHRSFVTKEDGQRTVKIQLLEGDSSLPEQCMELASAAIRNLPPGLPAGTKIDVWYSFQANGRLAVRASIVNIGGHAEIELERVRGLEASNVVRWKKLLARDGGYSDFEEALADYITRADKESLLEVQSPSIPTPSPPPPRSTDPAVQYGAPKAAADRLNAEFSKVKSCETAEVPVDESGKDDAVVFTSPRPRRMAHSLPLYGKLIGHVLASLFGLTLGYYLLCWIRPEANFLNLDLPGLTR